MGEPPVEGAAYVQAMEQDRNDPGGGVPRVHDPAAPQSDDVMRWVAAGIVAAAALLGLVVLVGIVVYAFRLPGWMQTVLGIVMVAGTVFFAWLLASALRKDDAGDAAASPRRR